MLFTFSAKRRICLTLGRTISDPTSRPYTTNRKESKVFDFLVSESETEVEDELK